MKRIWTLGSALVAFVFCLNANALYIEPKLDYSFLSLESSLPAGGLKGTAPGLRLGYALPLFTLAFDYSGGSMDAEISNVTVSADVSKTGATLIFAPPVIPFNILAGYYQAELKTSSTTYKGDGTKFGIMLTMLPIVNINVEYFNTSYDKDSLRDKGVTVGLSADFDL